MGLSSRTCTSLISPNSNHDKLKPWGLTPLAGYPTPMDRMTMRNSKCRGTTPSFLKNRPSFSNSTSDSVAFPALGFRASEAQQ